MISIGTTLKSLRNKDVARNGKHRVEHFWIVDLVVLAKPFDHSLSRDGVILKASICGLLTGGLHEVNRLP